MTNNQTKLQVGGNYYSKEFNEKLLINNIYPKTVDVTYIHHYNTSVEKSSRRERQNRESVEQYIAAFFTLIGVHE